ncbi:uncharacterized protein K02A2.6-like [Photinus pyralis]|uniref:uncharacterized protein K02A2.6-like n=1 Tax=Photinus pyralis TaxID=7054 RepID=UPI0012670669|nr:uncharacterized protein K02A2.6-like [Photinus pyralis]
MTKQINGQSIEQYVTELKKQAANCKLDTLHDDLIVCMLVCGTNNVDIRQKLLQEEAIDLEKALKLCSIIEQSKRHAKKIEGFTNITERDQQTSVDQIAINRPTQRKNRYQHLSRTSSSNYRWPRPGSTNRRSSSRERTSGEKLINNCSRCGTSHLINKCPAFNKVCGQCKLKNHYASMCKTRKQINMVASTSEESNQNHIMDNNSLFISSIQKTKSRINIVEELNHTYDNNSWFASLEIVKKKIKFKIDTGAMANILPIHIFMKIGLSPQLITECSSVILKSYSGDVLPVLGTIQLSCLTNNAENYLIDFHVINDITEPLLGLKACAMLNLIKKVDQVNEVKLKNHEIITNLRQNILIKYNDLFTGIGCIYPEYHIQIEQNAQPVICPIRKVPIALIDKLKLTLDNLEKNKIIQKVDGPTEWLHPLVLVKKSDNNLRICLDPLHLNKVIKREYCKLPTFEELTYRFTGAKWFSRLDANQAFYQIPLDETSSNLLVFGTPVGRYKFRRLPFGLKNASEVFNERFQAIFQGNNIATYIDDIIVWGKTLDEHNLALEQVFKLALQHDIKFNKHKCSFGSNQIKLMGHIINEQGIAIDPDRIKAITEFPEPKDKQSLQRFLGIINYVGKFIPNFSAETSILRQLIRKDTFYQWNFEHRQAFKKLKNSLTTTPTLQIFDPLKEVTISVDASQAGLGGVLLQNNKPVSYCSKALSDAQVNYAQIEKELLAVLYGLLKFHEYTFGRLVTIETDHKPLIAIINKPLSKCPARLQRIMLQLQKYQFNLVYKAGKHLIIADALSRAYINNDNDISLDEQLSDQVCTVIVNENISDDYLNKIQIETNKDPELIELSQVIKQGWPKSKSSKVLNDKMNIYCRYKDTLVINEGIIYNGPSVLVPKTLRQEILRKIHYSHLGFDKNFRMARDSVFWPNLKIDLRNFINNCQTCQKYAPSQPSETLHSHEIPKLPWHKVGCDLFEINNAHYLLVVDYYSKFIELEELKINTTSNKIINILKSIFARHGVPKIVVTDGGPQFSSDHFKQFSTDWCFNHTLTSPYHSQSNGMAERHVQIAKKLLKKTIDEDKDIYLALLQLRNSPIFGDYSPAEILMSRKMRNPLLPIHINKLKPHVINVREYNSFIIENQQRQVKQYNKAKGAKELDIIEPKTKSHPAEMSSSVTRGCPQDDALSPLLWYLGYAQYADDIAIVITGKFPNTVKLKKPME